MTGTGAAGGSSAQSFDHDENPTPEAGAAVLPPSGEQSGSELEQEQLQSNLSSERESTQQTQSTPAAESSEAMEAISGSLAEDNASSPEAEETLSTDAELRSTILSNERTIEERVAAVERYGDRKSPEVMPFLMELIEDKDQPPELRASAFRQAASRATPELFGEIARSILQEDPKQKGVVELQLSVVTSMDRFSRGMEKHIAKSYAELSAMLGAESSYSTDDQTQVISLLGDLGKANIKKGEISKLFVKKASLQCAPELLEACYFGAKWHISDEVADRIAPILLDQFSKGDVDTKYTLRNAVSHIDTSESQSLLVDTLSMPVEGSLDNLKKLGTLWEEACYVLQDSEPGEFGAAKEKFVEACGEYCARAGGREGFRDVQYELLSTLGHIRSDILARLPGNEGVEKVSELDRKFGEIYLRYRDPELQAQDVLENVIATRDQWMDPHPIHSEQISRTVFEEEGAYRDEHVMSWLSSAQAIWTLFVSEASDLDEESKADTNRIVQGILRDPEEFLSGGKATEEQARKIREESQALLEKLKDPELAEHSDPEAMARAVEFLEQVVELSPGGGPTANSVVYAKIFNAASLSRILQNETLELGEEKRDRLNKILEKIEDSLARDIGYFNTHTEAANGSSLLNTYALTVAALALPPKKVPAKLLSRMREFQSHPTGVPYSLEPGVKPETPAAAAARSVPYNLLLYRQAETAEQKTQARENLISALENYDRYTPYLIAVAETGSSLTHSDLELIAPYYYYPTVPYVADSLAILAQDAEISPEQRQALSRLAKSTSNYLVFAAGEGRSFGPQNPETVLAAPMIHNAFGGLALMGLMSGKPRVTRISVE